MSKPLKVSWEKISSYSMHKFLNPYFDMDVYIENKYRIYDLELTKRISEDLKKVIDDRVMENFNFKDNKAMVNRNTIEGNIFYDRLNYDEKLNSFYNKYCE